MVSYRDAPESEYVIQQSTNSAMETDTEVLITTIILLLSLRKKVTAMIEMSLHQLFCYLQFIHISADGEEAASTLINYWFDAPPGVHAKWHKSNAQVPVTNRCMLAWPNANFSQWVIHIC